MKHITNFSLTPCARQDFRSDYSSTVCHTLIVHVIVILLFVEDENDDECEYDLRILKIINPERGTLELLLLFKVKGTSVTFGHLLAALSIYNPRK